MGNEIQITIIDALMIIFSFLFSGLVWAQRVNRELYVLPPDGSDATLIDSLSFVSYSVNEHAVWGLTMEGDLYVRTGMSQHCPQGVDWTQLEMLQLGQYPLLRI